MSLKEIIEADLKNAMKSADSFKVGVLRLLKSSAQNEVIAKYGADGVLSDDEYTALLKREAKKRKESIALYNDSNRPDLAENEIKELEIISTYLPPEINREEVEKVVKEVIAGGALEFSSAMKESMSRLGSGADGKVVSDVVKSLLNNA